MGTDTASKTFDELPATGYVQQAQLIPGVIPVSSATWWRWVKLGKAPAPHKLGERVTCWKVGDIRRFLAEQSAASK